MFHHHHHHHHHCGLVSFYRCFFCILFHLLRYLLSRNYYGTSFGGGERARERERAREDHFLLSALCSVVRLYTVFLFVFSFLFVCCFKGHFFSVVSIFAFCCTSSPYYFVLADCWFHSGAIISINSYGNPLNSLFTWLEWGLRGKQEVSPASLPLFQFQSAKQTWPRMGENT